MEKRKILIADSFRPSPEREWGHLKRDSFDLHRADTGKKALDLTLKVAPHLVLFSSALPDLSAEEFCSSIKKDPDLSRTKVAIVTTDQDADSLARYIDAGCDGIVTRPFDKEKLLETVQKLLGETFRRMTRMSVRLPCALYLERIGIPGTMLDISEIGCRVTTEDFLEKGTIVGVGFNLPDTDQPVKWEGVVHWSLPHWDEEGHTVMGIEFMETAQEELEALQDILASMPESSRL